MSAPRIQVHAVDYHRNGIGGVGFHVVRFADELEGEMVATVFPEAGEVAVLQLDKLVAGDTEFGSNSWRGDNYEPALRKAIKEAGR